MFLLDFGRTSVLPCSYSHIRQLLPQFCSVLPAQAVVARLAHIVPPLGSGGVWPESTSELFLKVAAQACRMREDSGMVGLVARMDGWGQDGVPVVTLYDTVTNTEENGIDLAKVLVTEGEARIVQIEERPCLSSHFPNVDKEHIVVDERLFINLEHILGVQMKIEKTMTQLVISEKERGIVLKMIELQRKWTQEMYDLQFEKVREGGMPGNVCINVDTTYDVVAEDEMRGEGDRKKIIKVNKCKKMDVEARADEGCVKTAGGDQSDGIGREISSKNEFPQLSARSSVEKCYRKSDINSITENDWTVGQICIAKWIEDYVWYRAQILEIVAEGLFNVIFIDYGNKADVGINDLVKTVSDIPGGDHVDENIENASSNEVCIQGYSEHCEHQPIDKPTKVHQKWSIGEVGIAKWVEDDVWYRAKILDIGDEGLYTVIFIDYGNESEVGENNFVMTVSDVPFDEQKDENVEELSMLSTSPKSQHQISNEITAGNEWIVGENCIAKWREDDVWYRAKIAEIGEEGLFKVIFMDYGNEAEVGGDYLVKTVFDVPTEEEKDENVNDVNLVELSATSTLKKSEEQTSDIKEKCLEWTVGQFCVAKWIKDDVWYRAKILDRGAEGLFNVVFIDYGNEAEVGLGDLVSSKADVPEGNWIDIYLERDDLPDHEDDCFDSVEMSLRSVSNEANNVKVNEIYQTEVDIKMDLEMKTVYDIVEMKEGRVLYDSKMKESSYGDSAGAGKGKFVSRLHVSHGVIHLVTWKKIRWVISMEISKLIPEWLSGYDCLNIVLKYKSVNFQMETLDARDEKEIWQELVMEGVGGLVDRNGKSVSTLSLYRFEDFFDILDILQVDLGMLYGNIMEIWEESKDFEI